MQNAQSLESFPGKEKMEQSMQKLEKDLKEARHQRDKALQELNRLKKHLLDKVAYCCILYCSHCSTEHDLLFDFTTMRGKIMIHTKSQKTFASIHNS